MAYLRTWDDVFEGTNGDDIVLGMVGSPVMVDGGLCV